MAPVRGAANLCAVGARGALLPDRDPRAFDELTPYVVSRPAWLVGDAPPPPTPPWAERKALFFSGHVPKVLINPLRLFTYRRSGSLLAAHLHNYAYAVCVHALRRPYRTPHVCTPHVYTAATRVH